MKRRTIALALAVMMFVGAINISAFRTNAAIEPTYKTTYTDDFSDSNTTFTYMEEAKFSGTGDALPDGSTNFMVEDGVLKQGMTAKYQTYWQYLTFKDDYLPDKAMVEQISVDITFSGYNDKDQTQNRILAYYDPTTGDAVEFSLYHNGSAGYYGITSVVTNLTVDTTNKWGDYESAHGQKQWKQEWIENTQNRYVLSYNYFNAEDGTKVLQIVADFYFNSDFETVKAQRVVNVPVDSFTGFKTGIKACTKAANVVTFDNFSFTYSGNKTDEQLADEFRTRNTDLLAKDSNDVTVADLDAYVAAMSDYESISESAQLMVAEEYTKLQTIYAVMQKNVADTFYAKHKEILDKQVTDIAVSDKTILFDALEDVQGLSEFEATALATYISDLETKKEKFYAVNYKVNGDDFEHELYTDRYWVTENYTTDTTTYTDYSFEEDGENMWLVPGVATKGYMNTIASEYWTTGRQLAEVSMDVHLSTQSATATIFSYYDSDTQNYAGFKIVYSTNASVLKFITTRQTNLTVPSSATTCTDGSTYKSTGNTNMADFTYGNTYRVKMNYSYVTGTDETKYVYVYCTITDFEGNEVGSRYDLLTTDNWTDFKVGVLLNTKTTDYAKYDNFSFTFFNTEEDNQVLANEFTSTHSEILNKTYDELVAEDLDVINATLSKYEGLDEAVKPYLTAEVALLNTQLTYLDNQAVLGSIDTDDINSCLKAWRVFKGETERFRNYCLPLYQEIYATIKEYNAENEATDEQIDIITVGHSMVYGQGARGDGIDNSYPVQLQTMLDEAYGEGGYAIVNDGVRGFNVEEFLVEARMTKQESFNSDIVIITIGANDTPNDAFVENYHKVIESFQTWQSAPTIIVTTDPYMVTRDNSQRAEVIRTIAEEHELPLVDLYAMTYEAYQTELENFKSEYKALYEEGTSEYESEDAAIAAAEDVCFAKWFITDGIHYQAYGYGKMAEYVFAALENTYCDFNIQYADIKNMICYDNEWDDTYLTDVETLDSAVESLDTNNAEAITACQTSYNALSNIQKMKFESEYHDSYVKLIDAINYDLALIAVNGFKETYSDIHSISTVANYTAAQKAYEALNDTAKRMLTTEKEQLDVVCATIKPQAIEQLIADGVTNTNDYTSDMLLAANSKINTYSKSVQQLCAESRKSILNTLKTTKTAYNEDIKIFCAGDSITYGVRNGDLNPVPYTNVLDQLLGEGYHVYNGGQSGATFYGTVNNYSDPTFNRHYEYAAEYQPDIVILMLGTNDAVVRKYTTEERCVKGGDAYNAYVELIQYFQGLESAPQVILATVPWSSYITDNSVETYYNNCVAMQKAVAEELGLNVLDMAALTAEWPAYDETSETNYEYSATDHLHYSSVAYEEMAEYAYSVVKGIVPEQIYGYLKSVSIEEGPDLYQTFLNNKSYETADAYLAVYNQLSDTLKAKYKSEIAVIDKWLKEMLVSNAVMKFNKSELSSYPAVSEHIWPLNETFVNGNIYNSTDVVRTIAVLNRDEIEGGESIYMFSGLQDTSDTGTAINDKFGVTFSNVALKYETEAGGTSTATVPVINASNWNLSPDATNVVYKSIQSYGKDQWAAELQSEKETTPFTYAEYEKISNASYVAVELAYVATEIPNATVPHTKIEFTAKMWADDGDGIYEEGTDVLLIDITDRTGDSAKTAYLAIAYLNGQSRVRKAALTTDAFAALHSIEMERLLDYPIGDLNGDEIVDDTDVDLLRKYLVGLETTITESAANVNERDGVDACDLVALKVLIKEQEVLP